VFYSPSTYPSFLKYLPKTQITLVTIYTVQDEIIDICATSVRDLIIEEVGTGTFSIMCDQAR